MLANLILDLVSLVSSPPPRIGLGRSLQALRRGGPADRAMVNVHPPYSDFRGHVSPDRHGIVIVMGFEPIQHDTYIFGV